MTELFEPVGPADHRLALDPAPAAAALAAFNLAGVLEAADMHVATRVGALASETDPTVLLAAALAVRAVRLGSVCVDLAAVAEQAVPPAIDPDREAASEPPDLPWPEPQEWAAAVADSALVAAGVLHVDGTLVHLDRYHRLESQVARDLLDRTARPAPDVDSAALQSALARIGADHFSAEQQQAAARAVSRWTTVLTGGPGTGKTTTVARLLALMADQARARGEAISIALAAPTGKAAARLLEAVEQECAGLADEDRAWLQTASASTLHRLLGWRRDNSTRFRHDRGNRLKHDVVVVDECSMVDLTLMARLLEAVRPDARLVLVGDPGQLTSVGAGAVLRDVVDGFEGHPASPVERLTVNHRADKQGILDLAAAIRDHDADRVLEVLRSGAHGVDYVESDDAASELRSAVLPSALACRERAEAGDAAGAIAALSGHRLLCAHRDGPWGVAHWNRRVEEWIGEEVGQEIWDDWYVGRPLLITANDYALGVHNGETGAAVQTPQGLRAFIDAAGAAPLEFHPGRLGTVETMHAMTIHKAQGSQAAEVTVLLPPEGSRLLTRELFYTAVTRAQERVRVIGPESAVRAAVESGTQRATGLVSRLAFDRTG